MALDLPAAVDFLRDQMYDSTDKLAHESTNSDTYYIHSANALYYTAMYDEDNANAIKVLTKAVTTKSKFGKCQNTTPTYWYYVIHPTWRAALKSEFEFKNTLDETWGSLTNGEVHINNANRSAISPDHPNTQFKCCYIMNQMAKYYNNGNTSNLNNAESVWQDVLDQFDDSMGGYWDEETTYLGTFKQALVKICSDSFPELAAIGTFQEATGLWDGNLQDPVEGGIYLRYEKVGGVCNHTATTFQNTEATSSIILAYRPESSFYP